MSRDFSHTVQTLLTGSCDVSAADRVQVVNVTPPPLEVSDAEYDWACAVCDWAAPLIAEHYGFDFDDVWETLIELEGESGDPCFGKLVQTRIGVAALAHRVAFRINGGSAGDLPVPLVPRMH